MTTDFGSGSPYAGAVKGVILSIAPQAVVVDITHAIPPQNVVHAAWVLAGATRYFPPGTIHVAVVDPTVGSERAIVYALIAGQQYIAPDNGLLGRLAALAPPSKIITLRNRQFWLPDVSSTFHGRDIMAPVAAHLSLGVSPDKLGPPQDQLVEVPWPEVEVLPNCLEGEIVAIDSYGNLVTNITSEMLTDTPTDASVVVRCDEHETAGIFATYADQPAQTLVAVIGSSGQLELAIVGDSAATMLAVRTGEKVTVSWE